jgi:hypothetical protein
MAEAEAPEVAAVDTEADAADVEAPQAAAESDAVEGAGEEE